MQGGCEAQCTQPKGALFCDGQYVDAGNNLQECLDALVATFKIEITGYATGSSSSSCSGNTCEAQAEGQAGCSCRTPANGSTSGSSTAAFAAVAALAAGAVRRRKTRRS
jgi:MYXO-CTERM domain-containing protein